jgi:hypothetical protein
LLTGTTPERGYLQLRDFLTSFFDGKNPETGNQLLLEHLLTSFSTSFFNAKNQLDQILKNCCLMQLLPIYAQRGSWSAPN